MAVLLDAFQEAVGSIKDWLRASTAVPLPPNWMILDGSTVVDPDSQYNGIALPDSRSKFHQGHPTLTNANFGADVSYRAGGTIPNGGAATQNLLHNHPAGAHTHSVAGHTHVIPNQLGHAHNFSGHSHSVPQHSHSITHTHSVPSFNTGNTTNTSNIGGIYNTAAGINYPEHQHAVPSHNTDNTFTSSGNGGNGTDSGGGGATDTQGAHDHGGSTGTGAGNTGAGSGNTDNALSSIDNTPPWFGMLKLIKVK